ncbi:MAG TPA: DUF1844 domain-containing protein [Thermoanaerobaculia bacterium]|nr:DUF1844 domain-containing protein [Thermoanaerobaculia bacterium]
MDDSPRIKVTDRRMFTSEGELRADSELEPEDSGSPEQPSPPSASAQPARSEAPPSAAAGAEPSPQRPATDAAPALGGEPATVSFLDLVGMLAEPIALYLGDLALPNGERAVDLDQARVYIDLLDVLQEKTRGNLSGEEEAVLSDLAYRLKMRYVQKRQGG